MRTTILLALLFVCGTCAAYNDSGSSGISSSAFWRASIWWQSAIARDNESEFPADLFTEEELARGAVVLHVFGALYSFLMIGIVCSNYFLPSVDCICLGLNLSQDVAAATFMSFATTAPEFFTVLIGTFITEPDVGLGAVIGSGMFNILGVATFGGLAASKPIQLDWWPLIRDSSVYVLSLTALVVVINDGVVTLTNAAFLCGCYFVYFILMLANQRLRRLAKCCVKRLEKKSSLRIMTDMNQQRIVPNITITPEADTPAEEKPADVIIKDELDIGNFEDDSSYKAYFINYDRRSLSRKSMKSEKGSLNVAKATKVSESEDSERVAKRESRAQVVAVNMDAGVRENDLKVPQESHTVVSSVNEAEKGSPKTDSPLPDAKIQVEVAEDEEEFKGVDLLRKPDGSFWEVLFWLLLWPGSFLLFITVPDCRVVKWRKYYPLTFLMCVFWIGVTSYFSNWMISVVGSVIGIPSSVMGLTFLAAGGSMPEAISTVIMARQGEGGLGFSNSLGGNTMDICLCLGFPWLLKCLLSEPIKIGSESLRYNSIALFIGIFILIGVSVYTKFNMNRKMGIICCLCYLIFIVVSILFELEVITV